MKITVAEQTSASKKLQASHAFELLKKVDEIYASKGSKVAYVNLRRDQPDDDTLKALILGPTGNLRAPTLLKGKTLIIGFNHEQYQKVFA